MLKPKQPFYVPFSSTIAKFEKKNIQRSLEHAYFHQNNKIIRRKEIGEYIKT